MEKILHSKNLTLISYAILALIAMIGIPFESFANTTGGGNSSNQVVVIMCRVIEFLKDTGKPIIIVVFFMVGTGLFFGKITWGLGITIVFAIGVLFGAENIVMLISGDANSICAEK
jgi:type IV secretory pathway VirB2 component (pilin)